MENSQQAVQRWLPHAQVDASRCKMKRGAAPLSAYAVWVGGGTGKRREDLGKGKAEVAKEMCFWQNASGSALPRNADEDCIISCTGFTARLHTL